MKLRNINIEYEFDHSGSDLFTWCLAFHSNFINHYISREIRKMKIDTDGTYNRIVSKLSHGDDVSYIREPVGSLIIQWPYNQAAYLNTIGKTTSECFAKRLVSV